MKRILLLLLLPLLTVVSLLAAEDITVDGVTYSVRPGTSGEYRYVSAVDSELDTIWVRSAFRDNSSKTIYCDSVAPGVFDDHKNLRVLFYSLYKKGHWGTVSISPGFKGCVNLQEIKSAGNDSYNDYASFKP